MSPGPPQGHPLIVQAGSSEDGTDLAARYADAVFTAHRTFTGTPVQVADVIQEWFDVGAADGFNIMPPVLPSGLDAFVDHVGPILQERGLFRTEYTGRTLREHYGLARPGNQYADVGSAAGLDRCAF